MAKPQKGNSIFTKILVGLCSFFVSLYIGNTFFEMKDNLDKMVKIQALMQVEIDNLSYRVDAMNGNHAKVPLTKASEVSCLTDNIYFEANLEPYEGKLAVAEVTLNRVNKNGYPKSICGVVHQKRNGVCQFSWFCKDGLKIDRKKWESAHQIALHVVSGEHKANVTQGALFFHASYTQPYWAESKVFVKQIGNHLFYK